MALQTKTFSCGSFAYQSDSNAYVLDLILTEESVDKVANTSLISYKLQLRSGGNNRFEWSLISTLTFNGAQVDTATAHKYLDYHSTWVLLQGQTTVAHNADGTLDLAASGAIQPKNGGTQYTPPSMAAEGTMTLTAIPRASGVAATDANIGSAATIAVSRKSADYTHSLHYAFGDLSGYLADSTGTLSEDEVLLGDTTVLFPIPEVFYDQIPNSPTGVCTLTCTTYAGDAPIGTATAAFTVTADPALCGPEVTGRAEDVCQATLTLTGDAQTLVRGVSAAQCTVEAAARRGASLAVLTVNGQSCEGVCTLEAFDAPAIVFRAVDSRGYSAEYTVPGLTLVDYVPLSFNLSAARTDPTSGQATLTVTGKWYPGSFGVANNSLTLQCSIDGGDYAALTPQTDGGDFSCTATLSGLDYRTGHTIDVQVADALASVQKSVSVSRGIPVFHWGREDFVFQVPVTFTADDGTAFRLELTDGQLTARVL